MTAIHYLIGHRHLSENKTLRAQFFWCSQGANFIKLQVKSTDCGINILPLNTFGLVILLDATAQNCTLWGKFFRRKITARAD
jgi:hypothetical protein